MEARIVNKKKMILINVCDHCHGFWKQSTFEIEQNLKHSLREDQAGVMHVISPFSMQLCQVEGTTQ